MERKGTRSVAERREVRSVYMTVPTIVLNASPTDHVLSHSKSAGELDNIALKDEHELNSPGKHDGVSKFSSSMADDMHELESRNNIGLYCSPRMPRRSVNSDLSSSGARQTRSDLDTLNACNLNCLDPGSRVGSTVSLTSEYTTRSVGLISNDSSSECSQHFHGIMDGSIQKHSVLKRFYSSPEKDDDMLHTHTVRRNSKSMGNMQGEAADACVCFEFGSDSTDDNFHVMETLPCGTDNSMSENQTIPGVLEPPTEHNLVTMVTGGASLREGRIRKWLTEINGPDEKSS